MSKGRYYMARVIKQGQLNQAKFLSAISQAPVIAHGQFEWTITDVVDKHDATSPYIFGNLAKYSKEGTVMIVDEPAKQQLEARAPNLLKASAPFVYLPQYSGLAYLHVWNGIQEDVFRRRFKLIIEAAYDNMFVDCIIEPVADYRKFLDRLRTLDRITELSARVHPPNPLFGRLWGNLNKYLKDRQADEVMVCEKAPKKSGLRTRLLALMQDVLNDPKYEPDTEPDITDAAMLMAADGYGSGKAVGVEGANEVVIRTSESQKSFHYEMEPEPELLAAIAQRQFESVSEERNMAH